MTFMSLPAAVHFDMLKNLHLMSLWLAMSDGFLFGGSFSSKPPSPVGYMRVQGRFLSGHVCVLFWFERDPSLLAKIIGMV